MEFGIRVNYSCLCLVMVLLAHDDGLSRVFGYNECEFATLVTLIQTLEDRLLPYMHRRFLMERPIFTCLHLRGSLMVALPSISYILLVNAYPITRGDGIYQEHMNEALERLTEGEWLHTFPEGKVSQEDLPIRRLKWGTASLIVRAPVTPIVLPIIHNGFEKVMPEKYYLGKRPPIPLCCKKMNIIVGEPVEFDIPKLTQIAISKSRDISHTTIGCPSVSPNELNEAAQRYLYTSISDRLQTVLENLRIFGKDLLKQQAH